MHRSNSVQKFALWGAITASGLTGCATSPYTGSQVARIQMDAPANRPPQSTWTPTEAMLECVGDRMREARILPVTVAWVLADTSGRTNVDQGMVMRSALAKVARRGSGLQTTSMGVGPSTPGAIATAEEKVRAQSIERTRALIMPDWVIEGGVSSAPTGIRARQTSAGVDVRDASISASASRSLEEVRLSYSIKRFHDGVDIPGANVDLKVVFQQSSASTDLGAYIGVRIDGRKTGAGLRFGRSSSESEAAEDQIRVGVETAVAMLLADQFGIDLASCPSQSPPLPDSVAAPALTNANREGSPLNAFFAKYDALTERERVRWVQEELTAQNYAPGPVDGVFGPKTRQAVQRFEQDARLPPSDGSIRPQVLLALVRANESRPKDAAFSASGGVKIVPSSPVAAYKVGYRLRAQVVVPQGGWLNCFYIGPSGPVEAVFPILPGRGTYVSARAPLQLPSTVEQGTARHPMIVLSEPGLHHLYCALSRVDIAGRRPGEILVGGNGANLTMDTLKDELRRIAGADWLTDGFAQVRVVQ